MGTKLNWLTSSKKSVGLCVPCGATVSPCPTESASNLLYQVYSPNNGLLGLPLNASCPVMIIMEGFLQLPILVDHSIKPILKLILHSASRLVGPFPSVIGDAPRFFARLSRLLLQSNRMPHGFHDITRPIYPTTHLPAVQPLLFDGLLLYARPRHAMP